MPIFLKNMKYIILYFSLYLVVLIFLNNDIFLRLFFVVMHNVYSQHMLTQDGAHDRYALHITSLC